MKNKRRTITLIILIILITIIIITGCSLFGVHTGRAIGYKSICWEDNDHIIVYCNISQYRDVMDMGGGDIAYNWGGGELWRINANTGEKELLMSKKEWDYAENVDVVNIKKVNNDYYLSSSFSTYKVREDFNGWDSIGNYVHPIFSDNGNTVVAAYISNEYEDQIRRYDLISNTYENIYVPSSLVKDLDYDYSRNYLLVNNRKFVNINTGEETIVVDNNTKIGKYTIGSLYGTPPKYGNIGSEYITMDIYLNDTLTSEDEYHKIRISIIDTIDKQVLENIQGVLSPDGSKYISASYDSIWVIDTMGNSLNKITFDGDKI